jgi:hypothetical protein
MLAKQKWDKLVGHRRPGTKKGERRLEKSEADVLNAS